MPELTEKDELEKQKLWVKRLFHFYFPHVPSDVSQYFSRKGIFDLFLRFENEEPLTLSGSPHLQYPEDPNVPKKLEFDVPAMLDHEPFNRYFNNDDLNELKARAEREKFNIFEFMVQKKYENEILEEERKFKIGFQKYLKDNELSVNGLPVYNESIPYLFFKNFDNEKFFGEYDFENDKLIFNFKYFFNHNPKDIIEAYRYFAREIYNLRAFGIKTGKTARDKKSLYENFYDDFIKSDDPNKQIPYYRDNLVKKTSEFYKDLLSTFSYLVEEQLESKIKSNDIYTPTDLVILIENIRKRSTNNILKDLQETIENTGDSIGDVRRNKTRKFNENNFKKPISLQSLVYDSEEGNEVELGDTIDADIDKPPETEVPELFKDIYNKILNNISHKINELFQGGPKEFIDYISNLIKVGLRKIFINPNPESIINEILKYDFTRHQNALFQLFEYFAFFNDFTDINLLRPLEACFNEGMRELLNFYKEEIKAIIKDKNNSINKAGGK